MLIKEKTQNDDPRPDLSLAEKIASLRRAEELEKELFAILNEALRAKNR